MKADAPPDPDRKLNVTFFRNYKARTLTAKNIAIEDLRVLILAKTASTKEKLPWLKLATFGNQKTDEGSLRHNANVLLLMVWKRITTKNKSRSAKQSPLSRKQT